MRGLPHQVGSRLFETETECRRGASQHIDPEYTDGAEREDAPFSVVLETQPNDQENDFSDIGGEQMKNEALDVGEEASPFCDCSSD